MRLNSSHSYAERGNDFYPSPDCAIKSLIACEGNKIPNIIWEPAAGDGAIVKPLEATGRKVIATDLVDYGAGYEGGHDYLMSSTPNGVEGIITNPPYKLARKFIDKALIDVPYSAWLLRINFLESVGRLDMFRETPPSRVWVSSRRLPTMHRHGWDGPKAPSNMCFAWFIFERGAKETTINWFDWKQHGV